jgi:hypothetical protein
MSFYIDFQLYAKDDNQLRALGPEDRAKAFKLFSKNCDKKIGTGDRSLCHGLYKAWEADIASGGTLFNKPKSGWFW